MSTWQLCLAVCVSVCPDRDSAGDAAWGCTGSAPLGTSAAPRVINVEGSTPRRRRAVQAHISTHCRGGQGSLDIICSGVQHHACPGSSSASPRMQSLQTLWAACSGTLQQILLGIFGRPFLLFLPLSTTANSLALNSSQLPFGCWHKGEWNRII